MVQMWREKFPSAAFSAVWSVAHVDVVEPPVMQLVGLLWPGWGCCLSVIQQKPMSCVLITWLLRQALLSLNTLSLGVLLPVHATVWGRLLCLQPIPAAMAMVQSRGVSSIPAMCFKAWHSSGSAPNLELSSLCGHNIKGPTPFSDTTW